MELAWRKLHQEIRAARPHLFWRLAKLKKAASATSRNLSLAQLSLLGQSSVLIRYRSWDRVLYTRRG